MTKYAKLHLNTYNFLMEELKVSTNKVFLAAIDMNRPLKRYSQFHSLIMENDLLVDMFVVAEGNSYSIDEKLNSSFTWIKSKDVLNSEEFTDNLVYKVKNGHNLLITFLPSAFSSNPDECDTTKINKITVPFGIRYTDIKIDSFATGRHISHGFECLHHPILFNDVSEVSTASAWHLDVEPPAKAIIVGDETCRAVNIGDLFENIRGSDLVCGAEYQKGNSGKLIVLSGLTFMDSDYDEELGSLPRNYQFASNLIKYLKSSCA